ncbi:MAG: DUF3135 domain-containing protein [Gammaproteobacteria bacterium]|nr:DUF3135 domain-containing protein [Gammaproteobacteria bacterium]
MSGEIVNFKKRQKKPAETQRGGFDFEYWSELAKKTPEEFEAARAAEINKYIASLDDKHLQERMQRVQWRVEMERERSKSPLNAAARIYDMMWESVGRSMKELEELTELLNPQAKPKTMSKYEKSDMNVLTFARKELEATVTE